MSKTVTVTISISTDTRVQGRYFVDVRDTTAGRNRQMTTRVLDDPAPFLAELREVAADADVAVTVTDTTGELATAQDAATTAEIIATATAAADDLDSKTFPELMEIAKLHQVPGRGTARKPQLIAGIRAARGNADAAFRRAMSAPGRVDTPQPVTAPAVLPGKAAPALVWSGRRELSGRYAVQTIKNGSVTLYRVISVNGGVPRTPYMLRLRDAKSRVQVHHEDIHRAHNTARLMEAARVAGDANWELMDAQYIDAMTEDGRRSQSRRAAAAPRPLSPLGQLAAAYRETHPAVAR